MLRLQPHSKHKNKRHEPDELDQWGLFNIVKLAFYAIILPPFRLFKWAIQIHPTQHPQFSWGHIAFDLFSVSVVLGILGLCRCWIGITGLAGFLFLATFLGISRRIKQRENEKICYDMDEIGRINYVADEAPIVAKREAPKVKFAEPKNEPEIIAQPKIQRQKTTPTKPTRATVLDFDENNDESVREFIRQHPELIRTQKQYK
jgi:hypothetical protein